MTLSHALRQTYRQRSEMDAVPVLDAAGGLDASKALVKRLPEGRGIMHQ